MPHTNIYSDYTNLGLMLKICPKQSKLSGGREVATDKKGEMCSVRHKSAATGFLQQRYHGIPKTCVDFSTISIFTELLTFLANMSKSPDRTVITLKQYVRGRNG